MRRICSRSQCALVLDEQGAACDYRGLDPFDLLYLDPTSRTRVATNRARNTAINALVVTVGATDVTSLVCVTTDKFAAVTVWGDMGRYVVPWKKPKP